MILYRIKIKLNMDLAQIYHKANLLIAQTYGLTGIPEKGYVIVFCQ